MQTITQSAQVKLTLSPQLRMIAQNKADVFGMPLSSYIKHLILVDVKDSEIPVYRMSEKTEKKGLKALKAHRARKTILVEDIDKFFDSL